MVLRERTTHSISRALAGCLLLALTLPCVAQTKGPEPAGFVVDVKGTWVTVQGGDPGRILHRKSYVFAGERIQARKPVASSAITIALATGKALRGSCVPVASCESAIVIDDEPQIPSIASRIGKAVMNLITPDDDHSAETVARDVFGPRPGVIGLKGEQLDLRPALTRIPEGSYLAVLAPGGQGVPDVGPEAPRYPAIVSSAGPVWIKTGALQPGLYRLSILSSGGKEPLGSAVLVLVASDKDFDARHRDFAEAQEVVSTWDEDIPATSVDYVLTVYLKAIASGATGKR